MKKLISFKTVIALFVLTQHLYAQDCKSAKDLENLPGKLIDAAHFEWPQQKATWLDELGTVANRSAAYAVLTKIETLEKQSRANYNLKGCVLKTSFSGKVLTTIANKYPLAIYELNMGCYEYSCVKNKMMVNSDYENVFSAYVNRYTGIENAFSFPDETYYYETPKKYNGKYIALYNFIKMDTTKTINFDRGFFQDIPETTVKQGDRNVYMTRHWYCTKPGALVYVPVTRKEYLEALLVYYEREKLLIVDKIQEKAKYPDWQQKIATKKAIVQKALKENTVAWLAGPVVVKPKDETFSWKRTYGSGSNDEIWVKTYNTDSKQTAQKTGSFTFEGFWDNKGGTTLYQYNPDYFKGSEKNPAKPFMIALTYRYVKTPLGQSLVENFTKNFDFDAVRNML